MDSACRISLGGTEPTARSKEDSSIPLVPVTQVCSHQNRVFPQPLALGQGGAMASGPRVLFQGWGWGSLSPAGCNEDACRTVAATITQSCRSHLKTKSAQGRKSRATGRTYVLVTPRSCRAPTELGFLLLILVVTGFMSDAGPDTVERRRASLLETPQAPSENSPVRHVLGLPQQRSRIRGVNNHQLLSHHSGG